MSRLPQSELKTALSCVECGAQFADGAGYHCGGCGRSYTLCRERPVLLRADNSLFPPDAYQSEGGGRPDRQRSLAGRLKALIPGRSINLARRRMFERLAADHGAEPLRILVIGCGHQAQDFLDTFASTRFQFVFCDIDKSADCDLYCDSHDLPFTDSTFGGVITTAVLEHVIRPGRVADEIHRVLTPDGFVYSEVPFLQAVHEGAYDFTRFSLGGHRALFDRFEERDAGLVAGPGTALTWALVEFFRSIPGPRRLSQGLGMAVQCLFFWLKYTDYFMQNSPRARDAASCTYFYGTRKEAAFAASDIVARYGRSTFSHT